MQLSFIWYLHILILLYKNAFQFINDTSIYCIGFFAFNLFLMY